MVVMAVNERAGLLTVAAGADRRGIERLRCVRVVEPGLAVAGELQSVLVRERGLVQAGIATFCALIAGSR